jgi:outer membrane protein TolC
MGAAVVLYALLHAAAVRGQAPTTSSTNAAASPTLPGVPTTGVTGTSTAFGGGFLGSDAATGTTSIRAATTQVGPPQATELLGLEAPSGPAPVLTLDDALQRIDVENPDVRIAAARVAQQGAALRRAWAGVLPQLSLGGNYTYTCTGGGKDLVSCGDRTTPLGDQEQLQQQATLFTGLADVLRVAADGNPDAGQAAELRRQAADLESAAAQLQGQDTEEIVVQPASVFSAQLTFTLPLFNGRAFPQLANAYAAKDVAEHARRQVREALRYAATRSYYAAAGAKRLVAIGERQLGSAVHHREATRARVEAQTQPALALRRAELEELRARQDLQNAQAAFDAAIATLGLLVGSDAAFDVVEPPPAAPPADAPAALIERALAARPEVIVQRLALTIAERQVTDAWMQFLPSVGLVATARGTSFTSGFVRDPVTGTLSLSATLPLYDGGIRYAALRESSERVREEQIRLRQLEDRVAAQVRGNLRDLPLREATRRLAEEAVRIAGLAVEQAQATFDAGLGTALDVSDTQLRLAQAEADLVRAELDVSLAAVGLTYVSGGRAVQASP